jgi:hypothetical protein
LQRQRGELLASTIEELASANDQSAWLQLDQVLENGIKLAFGSNIQNMKL